MDKKNVVKLLAVFAALLFLICFIAMAMGTRDGIGSSIANMLNGGDNKSDKNNENDIPSVSHLMYGIKYVGETKMDKEVLLNNIYSEHFFDGYKIDNEYCMVYQITSLEEREAVTSYLGIKDVIEDADYTKESIVLSVGKPLEKISGNTSGSTNDETKVLRITYTDDEYKENAVYVYRMNTDKFVSGIALEKYYWENLLPESNMVLDEVQSRGESKMGTYYRMYKKADDCYEIELYAYDGKTLNKRYISDTKVEFTEHKASLIKMDYGDGNRYYNSEKNVMSEEYAFNTEYLIYNYIRYMRVRNGEIQMIIRDAYDTYLYGKIVRLPFTNETEDMDSLVKSVTVLDDTHISVEYYKGADRELVTETVEVYNLYR